MTATLTAELAALAADVQARAAALTDRIRANLPSGALPNEFVGYLNLAANLLTIARDEITTDGLYIAVPADLDTADPTIDDVPVAQLATAGA